MSAYSVQAQNLSKSFTQGDSTISVLKDLSVNIGYGEVVAILGPSGSGKSTLLNILGLLSESDTGSYILNGQNTAELSAVQRAQLRLHRIGFIFQAFHLIDHKSVRKNVELPLEYMGLSRAEKTRRVDAILQRLGLTHRAEASIKTLSGGEKQRVAIARAFIAEPTLLLCDEPTGSLDEELTQEVINLLREFTGQQQSTIVVTHDPVVAAQCDRVLRMHEGRLAEDYYTERAGQQVSSTVAKKVHVEEAPTDQIPLREILAAAYSMPMPYGRVENYQVAHTDTRVVQQHAVQNLPSTPWWRVSLSEAWDATVHRVRRNLFTMLGVILGIASLVLTVGLTATISGQLAESFDVFRARHLVMTDTRKEAPTRSQLLELSRSEGYERVHQLNGVTGVALLNQLSEGSDIQNGPDNFGERSVNVTASVLGATPNVFEVEGHTLTYGRGFDEGHVERGDKVVVVSESVAKKLGIPREEGINVYIQGDMFRVIGIVQENPSIALSYGAVYIPLGVKPSTMDGNSSGAKHTQIVITTQAGAANQVAEEAPYALSPEKPSRYTVGVPPEPKTLREAVDTQQRTMLIAMSVITLIIGAMGIMNTFLVAVIERRREVGLRLALGMRPAGILVQIAAETLLTSIMGTIFGIVVAINGISIVSLMNHWTPIISTETIASGFIAGAVVGLLAGIYPALRAARIDPATTLAAG
ncbi:MAG: ATP-binding cassette domain-containing protein [Rothia sp. (in: high G+C Gram-positive bacteria)]|uniref:ABC transporter ATP-binding protein/permease n=1 Tax=Rothia sp. (in: high G+C Gram-positive bacteria) TaxID=1885016 RepID=UPI0026E0DCF6|nr:ATP-binding cassette domain-containing protein [Rothia sp. (in: high G+C Gram-positive bacteria)]MDO5749685.1 ATP-binding cassette domain-containing protein [Rothia sp. (in: high G+C Gram-positive bacteria)]